MMKQGTHQTGAHDGAPPWHCVPAIQPREPIAEAESGASDKPARFAEATMVIVMSKTPGSEIASYENERYDDEVLNAGWLPPGLIPHLEEVVHTRHPPRKPPPEDIDAFLQSIYRNQE